MFSSLLSDSTQRHAVIYGQTSFANVTEMFYFSIIQVNDFVLLLQKSVHYVFLERMDCILLIHCISMTIHILNPNCNVLGTGFCVYHCNSYKGTVTQK